MKHVYVGHLKNNSRDIISKCGNMNICSVPKHPHEGDFDHEQRTINLACVLNEHVELSFEPERITEGGIKYNEIL